MLRRAWLLALAALIGLIAAQGSAAASINDEEELWRSPGAGAEAGELKLPYGLGSDPATGHLYVVEWGGNRVSEFTPWGNFVKAFGWDVAPGAVNAQQEVRVRAAEGQFRLSFEASTTADLPFNASGAEVQAALNSLTSISGAGGSVSVEAVPGIPGTTPFIYVVAFKGSLAGSDVAQLGAVSGTTPLSGGVPATDLLVRTRAAGSAGGGGLENCTAESGCKAGLEGPGAGQFGTARGITVDPAGNVYVQEAGNKRVQKFDSAGRFMLMFGGEVNKTMGANLCTKVNLDGGDVCGAGIVGSGPGEFGGGGSEGIALCPPGKALCPAGGLFVADRERIQLLTFNGVYVSELAIPGVGVQAVAFDPVNEDLYATYVGEQGVHRLDWPGATEIGAVLKGDGPVATDMAGNLFVRSEGGGVSEYSPAGSPLSPPSCCREALPPPKETSSFNLSGLGTNGAGNLHVSYFSTSVDSFVRAFGLAPIDFEGAPPAPPRISAQFASSVQRDGATVAAEINPRFFPDTRYYVQYGTGECSNGGCPQEQPLPPGSSLTSKITNAAVPTAGVFLEGLTPGITYHYRFIAQSSGGGPVYGVDPDGPAGPGEASAEDGLEGTFITPDPIAPKACPNDVYRGGAAARLPNCRAYEMVSPIDKNNGDIKTLVNGPGYPTNLSQSAEDGSRLTYSSSRSFADPKAAPYTNQFLATRGPSGWASKAIDPPQGPAANVNLNALGNNFKNFSADLCLGWVVVATEPLLDPPRDTEDYPNVYRRENCGSESYEALIGATPTITPGFFFPEPQGSSADGGAAIFRVEDRLTKDAPIICVTNASATETISYQWLRNGAPIAGATSSGYVPGAADKGTAIQCQVTAHNGSPGSVQIANPPVAALLNPAAPPPLAPPSIPAPTSVEPLNVGSAGGQTLSCNPSEAGWQGSPAFSYQWYRNGTTIGGASSSTYVLTASDLATAATFQCAVTGTNGGGSVVRASANQNTNPAPKDPPIANASMPIAWQTYYASKGELHFLCILPSGAPSPGHCSGGTGEESAKLGAEKQGRMANVDNAISVDGRRVYWTASGGQESGAGAVYLRVNPGEEQSALDGTECTEPDKACTMKVSGTKTPQNSRFLMASPDGAKALFEVTAGGFAEDLFLFDLEGGSSTRIAGKVMGLAGASTDLSRIYFVSKEVLGGEAVAGEPNLYLAEGEEMTFIATLSATDAVIPLAGEESHPSVTARRPVYHAARASADGSVLAFSSSASPTGYDNTDLTNGQDDTEVYLYEAGSEGPVCVSCNPSGARPQGRRERLNRSTDELLATAATLPLATTMLHDPRALSSDGSRFFFNSFDALLPRDTNGAADLYMWESAPDKATCAALGAELYVVSASGCLSLISSGESSEDSEFADASPTGNDAFFITNSSLLSQDPGLFDVYDARAGGGLPPPGIPVPDCQGETCKAPVTAPNDPTPASSAYVGPGDKNEKAKKKSKGKKHKKKQGKKHKKKQGKKHKKKQGQKGRAAR